MKRSSYIKMYYMVWFGLCMVLFQQYFSLYLSWRSVLLVEETLQTLSHNVVSSTPRHERCSNSQL